MLRHVPVTSATADEPVTLEARVEDASAVFAPIVYFRPAGEATRRFSTAAMTRNRDGFSLAVTPTGALEYWIEVYDEYGNGPSRAGSADAPFRIAVTPRADAPIAGRRKAAGPGQPAETSGAVVPSDVLAPLVEHKPEAQAVGDAPVRVRCKVLSASGKPVTTQVYVRVKGLQTFTPLEMRPMPGAPDLRIAEIPRLLLDQDFEYYIEAFDEDGNGPGRSGSADHPHHVEIRSIAVPTVEHLPEAAPRPSAGGVAAIVPPESKVEQDVAARPELPVQATTAGPAAPRRTSPYAVTALAGGAAALVVGAFFGLRSQAILDNDVISSTPGGRQHSLSEAKAADANWFAHGTNALFLAGGLLGAGGLGVLVLDDPAEAR